MQKNRDSSLELGAPAGLFRRCTLAGYGWLGAVAVFWGLIAPATFAQPNYSFTNLAGSGGNSSCADATGTAASFQNPCGVAADSSGNFYIADTGNNVIRKSTPAGIVTTVAGTPGVIGSADGTGAAASFRSPRGIAVDQAGNIYIADTGNFIVRKITPAGIVTTLAGTAGFYGSFDASGPAASFGFVTGIAVNAAGIVYVADLYNHAIRKITPAGVVTTLAGSPNSQGSADGPGATATFKLPTGVAVDSAGNVYVADFFVYAIRRITPSGVVTTIAGQPNLSGSVDGTMAKFVSPVALTVDSAGNVYVMDGGSPFNFSDLGQGGAVRKITPSGTVTTLAGAADQLGQTNGAGSVARFSNCRGIAVDPVGNLVVADTDNHLIRQVTPAGNVTTFAGGAGISGLVDANGGAARFNKLGGLAVDSVGNVFVADIGNRAIRKVTPAGAVTTVAAGDGWFADTAGIAIDGTGNIYSVSAFSKIVKTTPDGNSSTLAGNGTGGNIDGPAGTATFSVPQGLVADGSGNVYVADSQNNTIRKVTPAGDVTTLAGLAGNNGSEDGTGSSARFYTPASITIDSSGYLYVADSLNSTIRRISPAGVVTTFAGLAGSEGNADGAHGVARFSRPQGIAIDVSDNLFVADTGNHAIRKITLAGVVSTLGGSGASDFAVGVALTAHFANPVGIAVDKSGQIYVSDRTYNTIMVGKVTTAHAGVDFNGDGYSDILWQNTNTGERFVWSMNGSGHIGGFSLGVVSVAWSIAVTADFNADGHEDILWQNTSTGERYIWFMNGTGHVGSASLGVVATAWSIVGASDFNGDGHTDILWQNTVTGERYIWLMSGAGHLGDIGLGLVDTQWSIVALADFNGDGQVDFLWQNTSTGERYVWFMSGAGHVSDAGLGIVSTQWSIATAADFNSDGHPDILWQNTITGQRYLWFMNGTAHQSDVDLGFVDSNWVIVK